MPHPGVPSLDGWAPGGQCQQDNRSCNTWVHAPHDDSHCFYNTRRVKHEGLLIRNLRAPRAGLPALGLLKIRAITRGEHLHLPRRVCPINFETCGQLKA